MKDGKALFRLTADNTLVHHSNRIYTQVKFFGIPVTVLHRTRHLRLIRKNLA